MDGRSLERELIQVVRTVEQLQRKYLDLLLGEEAGEEVGDTLDDYLQLCERLSDWLQQTDAATRVSCLVHRAMVRCTETSHASLLLPVLKLLQQGLTEAGECEVASQNPPTLPKLAVNLANKVGLAVEALESSSNDSVVYSRREARSVADICTRLLSIICQVNTDATRVVLERQADFREQLAKFLARQESLACRNVLEAVESEEECMRGEEKRMEATLLIQATYRMYKQRQWWGKLRQGVVALQQLARKRKKRSMTRSGGKESWLTELESVADRREKLERRFRRIQKLDPNKLDGFLQVEREVAASKIQSWWKRLRPRRQVEVEEKEEEVRKDKAAEVIQAAVRRWLEARQSSPAWSKLLQPRVISEERARELRRQIEVWQTRNPAATLDRSPDLHARAQIRYSKFLAGTAGRRLAEHRAGLSSAAAAATISVLEEAPQLEDYTEDMWSKYHVLSLPTATMARLQHKEAMERLKWPSWKRRLEEVILETS